MIIDRLSKDGAVAVSKLSLELGVTEETVRRDLEKLEGQELLVRTHGGAVPIDGSAFDLSLEKRKNTNSAEKEAIAKAAAEFVVQGDTLFLDASTTAFYMAKYLKKMRGITVITNSVRIINELSGAEGVKLIAIGGEVNSNLSFVGGVAEKMIEDCYFAGKVFFSSKGITASAGILESNEQECSVKRRMIKNAKTRYYLCDKSKIGKIGFVKLATVDEIDCFISDGRTDGELKKQLEENGVRTVEV